MADAELAEAGKRDLTPGGELVGDRVDRCLDNLAGLAGGESGGLGDHVGELVLGHATPFLRVVAAGRLAVRQDDAPATWPPGGPEAPYVPGSAPRGRPAEVRWAGRTPRAHSGPQRGSQAAQARRDVDPDELGREVGLVLVQAHGALEGQQHAEHGERSCTTGDRRRAGARATRRRTASEAEHEGDLGVAVDHEVHRSASVEVQAVDLCPGEPPACGPEAVAAVPAKMASAPRATRPRSERTSVRSPPRGRSRLGATP